MSAALGRFRTGPASRLDGVSNEAWQRFVAALEVQSVGAVSLSGGFGAFDMRPRRLVELEYAANLRTCRTPYGRWIYVCDFVLPWTMRKFLSNQMAQYAAFARSISLYHQELMSGEIKRPAGMSLAGALAILHIGGRGALAGWPKLFDNTRARYDAACGAF